MAAQTQETSIEEEILAMKIIIEKLQKLTPRERVRVMQYVVERLNISLRDNY